MKEIMGKKKQPWILAAGAVLIALGIFVFLANAGRMLVVDDPQQSDVILVLAGETNRRPARALELLDQGFGKSVVIDVPAEATLYDVTQLKVAEDYVARLPPTASVRICPIEGLSTREESFDAEKCLRGESGKRVLIVTSEFHTRRSLSIFRRELRGWSFSTAAARDSTQFGTRWWMHRQWAKTCLDEWLRVVWWNCFERWR